MDVGTLAFEQQKDCLNMISAFSGEKVTDCSNWPIGVGSKFFAWCGHHLWSLGYRPKYWEKKYANK